MAHPTFPVEVVVHTDKPVGPREEDAQKARAEAELHENRAQMHERGFADDRLGDEERSVGGARPEADDERRFSRERDIAGERSADDRVERP
jgi:hypothetical protein